MSGAGTDWLQASILRAYGLKPWDAGLAPVPLWRRAWHAVTPAYRRGRVIDWRSYNEAEAEARTAHDAYVAAMPVRLAEIGARISEGLPDGLRFEWGPE